MRKRDCDGLMSEKNKNGTLKQKDRMKMKENKMTDIYNKRK